MHRTRTLARLLLGAFVAFGCSSEPGASLETPSAAPTALATSVVTVAPVLDDRDCNEFTTREEAQHFFEESGGPRQDIHELDVDGNGRACDETDTPIPASPRATSPGAQARPAAVPGSPEPMSEHTAVSGSVEGPSGGSADHSSCESTDPSRCR